MVNIPAELVLLIWLHGFKGGDDTFANFPERLSHLLSTQTSTKVQTQVNSVVYPAYDTRGELVTAVDNHHTWLTNLVKDKTTSFRKEKGDDGLVRVVLLGHSMGGLVAADVARKCELITEKEDQISLLGVVAYDTPYLGLNPSVFKGAVEKVLGYAQVGQAALAGFGAAWGLYQNKTKPGADKAPPAAQSKPAKGAKSGEGDKSVATVNAKEEVAKKGWFTPAMVGAGASALLAGAAGAAFLHRDVLAEHWDWATSHLSYVGELWKGDQLEERVDWLTQGKVAFHCYYTALPPLPKSATNSSEAAKVDRTFCLLPHAKQTKAFFTPNRNTRAADEITAHVEMFTDSSDGIYALGRETDELIREWLDQARKREAAGR